MPFPKKFQTPTFFRRLVKLTLAAGLIFFFIYNVFASQVTLPQNEGELKLYSNQCEDDLRKVFTVAIEEAQESLDLYIYSLTDRHVIEALKQKAKEGIPVNVIHDGKTAPFGFSRLGKKVTRLKVNGPGLMHKKILVVDKQKVLMGSANFTTSSLLAHDNLVVGLSSTELAQAVLEPKGHFETTIGDQKVEFWSLPEAHAPALRRLLDLINSAEKSLKIAMFTWTHQKLADAVIKAHKRGIDVDVVVDLHSGYGASQKVVERLKKAGVTIGLSGGSELCHHKMALVDDKTLVVGSANWTFSAFSKNNDCFLVIHDLTKQQQKKLKRLWHVARCMRKVVSCALRLPDKKHLVVLGQRPVVICHTPLESITLAA